MARRDRSSDEGGRISFSRPQGLSGTLVLSATDSRRNWSMAHETFTLAVVTNGTGTWRCRGVDGAIRPGQVLLIAPGDVHCTRAVHSPGSFVALFLPPEVVRRHVAPGNETAERLQFKGISAEDPVTFRAMGRLGAALSAPVSDPFEVGELATSALRILFERHASDVPMSPAASPTAVRTAVEMIRGAFALDPATPGLTIESLADTLGANASALIRGFTRSIGLPPYQYLLRLRVEEALRTIRNGPRERPELGNLTDVALACGFYDLPHMGRVFRRVIGVPPSSYAAQIGASRHWRARDSLASEESGDRFLSGGVRSYRGVDSIDGGAEHGAVPPPGRNSGR